MTFWATRTDDGKRIDVHVTYGPVEVKVAEDIGHLRHFWHDLGRQLDQAETAGREAAAVKAAHEHKGTHGHGADPPAADGG